MWIMGMFGGLLVLFIISPLLLHVFTHLLNMKTAKLGKAFVVVFASAGVYVLLLLIGLITRQYQLQNYFGYVSMLLLVVLAATLYSPEWKKALLSLMLYAGSSIGIILLYVKLFQVIFGDFKL